MDIRILGIGYWGLVIGYWRIGYWKMNYLHVLD